MKICLPGSKHRMANFVKITQKGSCRWYSLLTKCLLILERVSVKQGRYHWVLELVERWRPSFRWLKFREKVTLACWQNGPNKSDKMSIGQIVFNKLSCGEREWLQSRQSQVSVEFVILVTCSFLMPVWFLLPMSANICFQKGKISLRWGMLWFLYSLKTITFEITNAG